MTTVHVVAINLLVADECIEFFNISYHRALYSYILTDRETDRLGTIQLVWP